MSFLLALQQHVKSSIRAVDEFDIHMDPVNREMIMEQLYSSMRDKEGQYIVITPGRLPSLKEDAHVVVVQSVGGRSQVRVVS
jgi:chromosome segregation protein